jgi:hypothetical protein
VGTGQSFLTNSKRRTEYVAEDNYIFKEEPSTAVPYTVTGRRYLLFICHPYLCLESLCLKLNLCVKLKKDIFDSARQFSPMCIQNRSQS